ncbi:MAG: ribbon-helix-helix protein, CopG family [bacterium]|nr:ribbon-helix-helix protein, CopG family [bacterium]
MRTRGTMTISLPPSMLARIERVRRREERTRSEFVREAIRVYLAHVRDLERGRRGGGRKGVTP